MFRIGQVDLCTSHPPSFLPLLHDEFEDTRVVAVWDGGSVRPPGFAREFAQQFGVGQVPETLDEMVDLVDAVLVHSADWDLHLERAEPFIRAGKPVLIDKPAVGNLPDLNRLVELQAKYGGPIIAGSSLRYAREIAALRAKEDLGAVVSVVASGPGDFFNYGIHTIEMLQGFAGTGVRCVEPIGTHGRTELFKVEHFDGPLAVLQLGAPKHQWHLTATTTTGIHTAQVDSSQIYRALLGAFVAMLRSGEAPSPLIDQLEAIKVALAAQMARRKRCPVYLSEITNEEAFDGHAFAAEYAKGKR